MAIFGEYARYYDLLYGDKDYEAEAEYLWRVLTRYHPAAHTLLDLGCGSGRHAMALAHRGYAVTGVDRSDEMIRAAKAATDTPKGAHPTFVRGDIRTLDLSTTFDAVVSLFHVMSYQVTDDDLRASLHSAARHLRPGGILVFDAWYGPAVLAQRPHTRSKQVEDSATSVTRTTSPTVLPDEHCVALDFRLSIVDKATGAQTSVQEVHTLRYLFRPEVDALVDGAGCELLAAEEWLTGAPLGLDTWSAVFVARKVRVTPPDAARVGRAPAAVCSTRARRTRPA